jgi:hypothetical protein
MGNDLQPVREPPITPLRDCSPEIQARFANISAKRATAVTRDGRLTCSCGNATGCTCRPATADAVAPVRPGIGHPSLIVAAMALRHLNDRLQVLEARFGLSGAGNGGSDIDARFAEAEAKRVAMTKQIHIDKIEKLAAEHEEKRNPTPDEPPADPKDQQPDDDRAKYGRFDPSSGDFSQKTKAHPAGDSVFRRHQIEAAENRAFRERELAANRAWIAEIEASNKERGWN